MRGRLFWTGGVAKLGPWRVVITFVFGLAASFGAYGQPPSITRQPASQTVFYGDPATFTVVADGSPALAYQWLRNGTPIASATANAYTLSVTTSNDNGAGFSVWITNALGAATSQVAVLSVDFGVPGVAVTNHVFSYTNVWRYNQSNNLDGVNWTDPAYEDTGWQQGPGLLAYENNPLIVPLINTTLLPPGAPPPGLLAGHAYYFRTMVDVTNDLIPSALVTTIRCDDGGVIYLNGTEAQRIRMPAGAITNMTLATAYPPDPTGGTDATADEIYTLTGWGLTSGTNVIAVSVHQISTGSSDIVWGMALDAVGYQRTRDTNPPTILELIPSPGTVVPSLGEIEVHFNKGVHGVEAGDLLMNGVAATNLTAYAPDVYVFDFVPPAAGPVQVAWSLTNGIMDLSVNSNRFAGGTYTYTVNPAAIGSQVLITEFMAGNKHTLRDEDGDYSDWLEIHNAGADPVSLGGWYLTDDPANLTKWEFPRGVTLLSQSYLLVWASGKNRTNAAAPLHTNFQLSKTAGSYLGLVYSDGTTIVSDFPSYPQQYDDVSYGRDRVEPSIVGYFTSPTPGTANATTGAGFAPPVTFSVPGRTFQNPFTLTLSTGDTNAVIRYALVTSAATAAMTNVPTSTSPIYTAPLTINNTTQVRARAFPIQTNYFPGPLHTETYVGINPAAAQFSSDVPLVLLYNFGAGGLPATYNQSAIMMVFGTGSGRASLTNAPDLAVRIGINIRGNTTVGYAVEVWDEYNDDRSVEVLGMPAQSDWVFYMPDIFDSGLMHNPLAYELSNQIGRYASRTRFAEVFLNTSGGTVGYTPPAAGDYNGLWVVVEKIKRDPDRVDIAHLQPENTTPPTVTGGYLLQNTGGRVDPNERVFYTSLGQQLTYEDPKGPDIQLPARAAQAQYIGDYFNNFEAALTGRGFTNPVSGYAAWIDVDAWIDHHLVNVVTLCADALRLSAFLYKDREEKLALGPIWDFDRSQGTTGGGDTRCFNPRAWRGRGSDNGTDFFGYDTFMSNVWMNRLFNDPDFWQRWIDRWQQLRRGPYANTNIFRLIDQFASQVRLAQPRMVLRYPETTPRSGTVSANGYSYTFKGTYQGEVDFQKQWYADRTDFIDTNFLSAPVFGLTGGLIPTNAVLTISANTREPNSTIYYTLDGTDPRLPGGTVNPAARSSLSTAVITLTANARVFARNYNAAHHNLTGPTENPPLSSPWSGPTVATFFTATPPLRITELMYNPPPPPAGSTNNNDDFEFIEFQNTSGAAINLQGYSLSGGVSFTFPNYVLGAGDYVLVVNNLAAFQSRYPNVTNIAGVYANNLSNSGDHLVLTGPLQEPILDFSYNDTWYPATDGLGFSLVISDPTAPPDTWGLKASWRPSAALNGFPGQADPAPPLIPGILVNEALTHHTGLSEKDTIELFNPTTNTANLSGWFLTNDRHQPVKYRISAGVTIPAGGYLTFDEDQFGAGPAGFGLSSTGDEACLFSGDANTNLTGYAHGFSFGAAPNGVSFGRYVNSVADEFFVLQSRNTLGASNAYPRVGPVVIAEFMYHPPDLPYGVNDTLDEYIELQNIAATNVPLYDVNAPTNTWQLSNAVEFLFPTNVVLPPAGRLLVVSFDPVKYPATLAAFESYYGVPANVPVYGPWSGALNNGGETIELDCPDTPQVTTTNVFVPYYLVEAVAYNNTAPWPTNADGGGAALQRLQPTLFGNDPGNWQAVAPFTVLPRLTTQPTNVAVLPGATATFVAAASGSGLLAYQWFFDVTNTLAAGTNVTLVIPNAQLSDAGSYQLVVTNANGAATSQVATLTVLAPPVITQQPQSQIVQVGGTVTFAVAAIGTEPFSYAWFYDTNTPLSATGTNLTLVGVQLAQAGTYQVVVTNALGATASDFATLIVTTVDPNLDSDGDGIPDWWMLQYFSHATGQAGDHSLAGDDADGDGLTNLQEYLAGTNPTDPASVLRIESMTVLNGTNAVFNFAAMPEKTYTVQWCEELPAGAWQKLLDVGASPSQHSVWATNSLENGATRFYRIVTPQLP